MKAARAGRVAASLIGAFAVVASLFTVSPTEDLAAAAAPAVPTAVDSPASVAAPAGMFDPGYIISDAEFYDSTAMSEAAIQSFLVSQPCSPRNGVPCLRDFTQVTYDKAAGVAGGCTAYDSPDGVAERASTIIAKVAQACRISPRVLLVLMQKEQSLVSSPSAYGYERAMGWGCPDTAPCDATQLGFFSQVYKSAWQFRQYTLTASSWRYKIGVNSIQYHPNVGCGAGQVTIRNQATANLYIYTPYQPNAAALANLYSTGDSCSSYGNRNFWRIFYDWFGNPAERSPLGQLENMQPIPGGVGIWGWAVDADTTDPVAIHVYVDGQMALGTLADAVRTDIGSRFGLGDRHGMSISAAVPNGRHEICVYMINVGPGSNQRFGCWTLTLGGPPIGAIENIQPQPGGIGVWGWALDPDSMDPIPVDITIDGVAAATVSASNERLDMHLVKPGYGLNHGFSATVPSSAGAHRVCASARDIGGTATTSFGCTTVVVTANPVGTLNQLTSGIGTIETRGWVVDPDAGGPVMVHYYLDGNMVLGRAADEPRDASELGTYANYGLNLGYSATLPVSPGRHTLCVYGINRNGGTNVMFPCRTIEVGGSPVGRIENGQTGFGTVNIWGWTFDPDSADSIYIHVYVDGSMRGGFLASGTRSNLTPIPAAYGDDHGFAISVPASPGPHNVCVYAINVGAGTNTQLGCFRPTVSGAPVGRIENIQTVGSGLGVWGYALDPDTADPIWVHAYVDGVMVGGFRAESPRDDIAASYPGYGTPHTFGFVIPATAGAHNVCVYAINVGVGTNVSLGCTTVTRN